MHRWFFADNEMVCKEPSPPPSPSLTTRTSSPSSLPDTEWIFKVKFDWQLCSNETLAICGSCPILGNWNVQHSLPLIRKENSSLWMLPVTLPRRHNVSYRYLVCALNARGHKIVRFWETHYEARLIRRYQEQSFDDFESLNVETFGNLNNKQKIERGWINPYSTVVQFNFYQNPFVVKTNIVKTLLHVKITPLKIEDRKKCDRETNPKLQPKNSIESNEEELRKTFAYSEVSSLQDQDRQFHKQSNYGTPCGSDEILIFNLTLSDMEHTAYQIDLYNYSLKAAPGVPPHHFGYQYVLPQELNGSEGTLQLIIMCDTTHRPIGSMKCDYLVVRSMHSHDFTMEKTFQRYWHTKHEGIYIGHRGCGRSFWFQKNILRENTIKSFNLAFEHGAEMVEFDVQLTKDMIPILYHDSQLYISKKLDIDPHEYDVMELALTATEINSLKPLRDNIGKDLIGLPLSKFTLEQLGRVKIYEPAKDTNCASSTKDNRPFITLENVLKQVNCKVGFVIELKWPQKLLDGTMQESFLPDFDKNEFVDAILHIVLQTAGSRRIVFSSFDADICTMVRLKQNRYPVLLIIHDTSNKEEYLDPRCTSIHSCIYFANAMDLLGIVVNSADIMQAPGIVSDIHEQDLCIFSWGKQNRTEDLRKYLKALGVDGMFCDRLNHALEPMDLKQNIFRIKLIDKTLQNNVTCFTKTT